MTKTTTANPCLSKGKGLGCLLFSGTNVPLSSQEHAVYVKEEISPRSLNVSNVWFTHWEGLYEPFCCSGEVTFF